MEPTENLENTATANWGADQKYVLLHILKYLNGGYLLHKAALLNHNIREVIQNARLLS